MNKHLGIGFLFILLTFLVSDAFADPNLPKGFTKDILARVMKGTIDTEKVGKETDLEFHQIKRAYFKGVDADEYLDKITKYKKEYIPLFKEVTNAKLLTGYPKNVRDKKGKLLYEEFVYEMELYVNIESYTSYFYPKYSYPQGRHRIYPPKEDGTIHVTHEIINQEEKIHFVKQHTVLIPHEGGLLIQDDLHVKVKKDASYATTIKDYMKEFFTRYIETFRTRLGG